MATEQFVNNAQTSLVSSIDSSQTSLNVVSAASFPSTPQFRVQLGSELLLVTGVSGTNWTVTRGYESTGTAAHSSGDPVTQVLTAGVMTTVFDTLGSQTANTVFAGPSSGGAATASFRSLVAADLPGGDWITGTSVSDTLDTTYTCTGTYADITKSGGGAVEVSITAGTWLVMGEFRGSLSTSGAVGNLSARLYNQTDATAVTNSEVLVARTENGGVSGGTATARAVVTVAGTKAIRLQARRWSGASPTWTTSDILSDSDGRTTLVAIRLK